MYLIFLNTRLCVNVALVMKYILREAYNNWVRYLKKKKYSVFLIFQCCSQFMCVKLHSVSKWGIIALTDSIAVNGTHLLLHRHFSALCKSKGGKIRKDTKKHWQMRKMILSDINMPLNHITEELEYKRTYALPLPSLLVFLLHFHFHPESPSLQPHLSSLHSFSLSMCLSRLSCQHPIMECFPEDLTLLCTKDDSHLHALC